MSDTSTPPATSGTPSLSQVERLLILVGSNTVTSIKYNPVETNIIAVCSIDETLTVANLDIKNIGKYGSRAPNAPVLDTSNVVPTKIKGWGNTLAWAPSGKNLTVAVHNCTMIRFDFDASYNATKKTLTTLRNLPLSNLFYSDESTLVGSGFDKLPLVFKYEEGKWVLKGACEKQTGGFLIKIEYNNTGKLSRDNDAKFMAKSRLVAPEFASVHFSNIISMAPVKAAETGVFFTADSKGNTLYFKLADMKAVKPAA